MPKSVVECAVARMSGSEKGGDADSGITDFNMIEVWCVFDIDEHPKVLEASQQAMDNGLKVAISNRCFELQGVAALGKCHDAR